MTKKRSILDNYYEKIKELFEGKKTTSLSLDELVEKLQIPQKHHKVCNSALNDLISEGHIEVKRGRFYSTKEMPKKELVKGKASVHPRGFAFVDVDGLEQDVFIPRPFVNGAVDKDIVEVEVEAKVSAKGPEGKITQILERAHSEVCCIIEERYDKDLYYSFAPLIGVEKDILVETKKGVKLKRGDRVLAKVKHWAKKDEPSISKLIKVMGTIENAGQDIECALTEFKLSPNFPKGVVTEAKKYGKSIPDELPEGRKDLTHLTTFTIDPKTAKDFDDALSIEKDQNGNTFLAVHIADVSHYVKPGSMLDTEAYKRGNSTYFPGKCLPMLPEELSNELCSLKEKVKRYTVSVLMQLDPNGELKSYEIVKGVIYSQKRFTYEEAMEVLDNKLKSPFLPQLKELVELCHKFKVLRRNRGSVDLAMPDISLNIDDKGNPTGFTQVDYDITHQLVEECMLKANEIVATHLGKQKKVSLYRVHEEPGSDQIGDFRTLAETLGFKLPNDPTPKDLQKLFEEAKGSAVIYQLSVAYIRSMKLAIYSTENIGHYGLSLENYTHFTSPIRRYSDLIIHRLLFDENEAQDMNAIADHCSETERVSFRAEMQVLKLKKLRLLQQMKQANPNQSYPAVVTKVKKIGIHFELENLLTDGFIHISNLSNDFYNYNQARDRLIGADTNEQFYISKKINIRLDSVDLILQEAEWVVAT